MSARNNSSDELETVQWIKERGADWLTVEEMNSEAVKVLRKTEDRSQGSFRGTVTTVTLFVELSRIITVHPFGPEAFGECVHQLIGVHKPFEGNRVYVSVSIESEERVAPLGTFFGHVQSITPEDVEQCLEESDQNLELETPRLSLKLTYINSV